MEKNEKPKVKSTDVGRRASERFAEISIERRKSKNRNDLLR